MDKITIKEIEPEFYAQTCPNCNGRGTVGYDKKPCPTCGKTNHVGIVFVPVCENIITSDGGKKYENQDRIS